MITLRSRLRRFATAASLAGGMMAVLPLVGCATGPGHELPTDEELAAFEAAGAVEFELDRSRLALARPAVGQYRLRAGDVIALEVPGFAAALGAAGDAGELEPAEYRFRVREDGAISLPVAGPVEVAGLTLDAVEQAIVEAFHPRFLRERPSVVATVSDYMSYDVSIVGAVASPGVYALRADRLSLLSLISEAGGIVEDGAGAIRIHRAPPAEPATGGGATTRPAAGPGEPAEAADVETFALPVVGLNIPFANVELRPGDAVEVEQLDPLVFTAIGLVERPGAYPYPQNTDYTLAQGLAIAGGVNALADPRWITVYRRGDGEELLRVSFRLEGSIPASAASVRIRPGDIVAVEQTGYTRARLLLTEVFRINFGAVYNPAVHFDND